MDGSEGPNTVGPSSVIYSAHTSVEGLDVEVGSMSKARGLRSEHPVEVNLQILC